MYSRIAWQHATQPQHRHVMSEADGIGQSHYSRCGDHLTLYLKMDQSVIRQASFQAKACGAVVAMASLGCGLLVGLTANQARQLSAFDLDKRLGGLPISKRHAILMFLDALHAALELNDERKSVI